MNSKFKNVIRLLESHLEKAKVEYATMLGERQMYEGSEFSELMLTAVAIPSVEEVDTMKNYVYELMEAIAMLGNGEYIAKVKDNTIDINNLYDIIQKDTGLTQHEIFEAIYNEDGNGSRTWVDKVNCEEIIEKGWADKSMKKVYQWLYGRMNAGELPKEFYIHVWW